MHPAEADRLCARLEAIWPRGRWPKATLDEWRKRLLRDEADLAERTIERLRDSHHEQPTIALWIDTYRAIQRGFEETDTSDEWEGPTDGARAVVAGIKADLERRGRRVAPPE